jgi:hypothetical protein
MQAEQQEQKYLFWESQMLWRMWWGLQMWSDVFDLRRMHGSCKPKT